MKKILFITIGSLSLGLGSIGVVLPVLPTTPFLLLSAYCFARGSQRFEIWLKETKLYQHYVADYMETKTIPKKRKRKILLNIYLLMGLSIYLVPFSIMKFLLSLLTIFITVYLFWFIPDTVD